jgi:predicted phosphodiesterase
MIPTTAMRVRILSDLHNEFGLVPVPDVDADLVVLAGDIDLGVKGLRWAAERFGGQTIIYVAGNHEYYGHAIPKLTKELAELGRELGVAFLERGSVAIDGVRFLGCSLWTDFQLRGQYAADAITAEERMTDFRRTRVSPSFRRVHARDHAQWHAQSVAWLRSAMPPGDTTPTVVITHHAPSARSFGAVAERSPIDSAYGSNLEPLIEECAPRLWVHGHTHRCADYTIGQTRIIGNARGYPGESVAGFAADLVVDITV